MQPGDRVDSVFGNKAQPRPRCETFIQAASLPKVERYLRWVSVFDTEAKQDLYSENFRQTNAEDARPLTCLIRGLRAPTVPASSMRRC